MASADHEQLFLVVGLGNPGQEYEGTRHNIGFRVVRALAERMNTSFQPALKEAKGLLARGKCEDRTVWMLLPLTYMNLSGLAVKRCLESYKIPISHCLAIVDDADLPFGEMRMRLKGSSGGHNGLKSLEAHLMTSEYSRLRLGIGRDTSRPLAEHVLDFFSAAEESAMPDLVAKALEKVECWLKN